MEEFFNQPAACAASLLLFVAVVVETALAWEGLEVEGFMILPPLVVRSLLRLSWSDRKMGCV